MKLAHGSSGNDDTKSLIKQSPWLLWACSDQLYVLGYESQENFAEDEHIRNFVESMINLCQRLSQQTMPKKTYEMHVWMS